MFWKRKRKQPVAAKGRSVQDNLVHMASIGMSPATLTQYQTLCDDIERATHKMKSEES